VEPRVEDLELGVDRDAELPLGTQLAWRLRGLLGTKLAPGDRLPSLREVAVAAGVNVNTVRAVYARLESEGLLRSEQGRGTFVAERAGEAATRRRLRAQIADLEATLASHPPPPLSEPGGQAAPSLLSTADLEAVRDRLVTRVRELDAARAELMARLEELDAEAPASERTHSSSSLAGARIRWVGA
jgi:GntR family transcriptional regulator